MPCQTLADNSTLIEKYLEQPAKMPAELRERIERQWGGGAVQLYALADLDASMRLCKTWLALGPKHIALINEEGQIRAFERSRIKGLRKAPGLSCTTVTFQDAPGEPALAIVRYTNRQRRTMENIQYVIEQQLKGAQDPAGDADEIYSNSVAHAIREAQSSVADNKLAVIWRLTAYLKPYRRRLGWGMFGATLMTLISLIPPFLTGYLMDKVIRPYEAGTLSQDAASHVAWLLIGGIAATYLIREVFVCVRLRTLSVLGEFVERDIRNELYEHLQTLSLNFFSGKRTGSLISRVTSDTDRLWEFLAFGVVEVVLSGVMLLGLGAILICMDWRLGLMMALPVPVFFYAIYWHGQSMQRIFLRAWRKWSRVTDVLSDTIPGVRVVKAFHQEDQEKQRFAVRNTDVTEEFNNIHASWTTFWPILMLAIHLLLIGVWAFGLPRVLHAGVPGWAPLTSGTFVSFLLYSTMFGQPIEVIGQTARMLNRATSSAYRIFEVLDTQPEIKEVADAIQLKPVTGRVTFEGVTFAYDGVRQILKGVSFDVQPGEMIGLVGPSGAGKTTITNLIVRFYEATGGTIRIDGHNLKDLDTGHFRTQVGMVLQDPYLFHGTILENIRYGMPDAKLLDVIAAARAANAHDFICKLPYGYDTVVGERGHTLSGGERQRISIARAVLTNPRILILDEATSSVDTETERKIQQALDRLIAGRTVFAIAHRLSTLKRASRLFVIHDGRLAEEGTHAELLAKPEGIYRKLHQMQQELHEIYAV
jgi:ATP-binding cassette subfamily B protein